MKSYSALQVFGGHELQLLDQAIGMIERLPASLLPSASPLARKVAEVRCHELARAVGEVLDLPVHDGKYGSVEHSWLLSGRKTRNILDVYAVGRLPQVQLVHVEWMLPHDQYKTGPFRTDIDEAFVQELVDAFRGG